MARDLNQEPASQVDWLSGNGSWAEAGSVEDAVMGADAVLILTEWQHYCDLIGRVWLLDAPSGLVVDARSVADPARVKAAGINLWRIGDGED